LGKEVEAAGDERKAEELKRLCNRTPLCKETWHFERKRSWR
jgi:hypothetical protein